MKRLDKCVNIIPVIAKSDTLTLEEREAFKRRVSVHDTRKLYNLYNRNYDGRHSARVCVLSRFSTGEYFPAKRLFSFVIELSAETEWN